MARNFVNEFGEDPVRGTVEGKQLKLGGVLEGG